ncbi:alpha/beta hydrolase [Alcaligenaceae bacterium CGII-47]|nr:alpha/beta hydrolase [Alcaligenaceae bacterium CGII-47]
MHKSSRPEVTFILLHGLLCDGDTWCHLTGPLTRLGTVLIPRLGGISSIPQAAQRCTGLVLMNTGYQGLAEVVAIPHAAHMAPFEQPEACTAAILGWLTRQGWATPAPDAQP